MQQAPISIVFSIIFDKSYADLKEVQNIQNLLIPKLESHNYVHRTEVSPKWLLFSAEFIEQPTEEIKGLIDELINLENVIDFDIEEGETYDFAPESLDDILQSGSASIDDWEENIPRDPRRPDEDGNWDFEWNRNLTRFPEAIQHTMERDRSRNQQRLNSNLRKDKDAVWIYQIDTGWSDHEKLQKSPCYRTDLARNFIGTANGDATNTKDSLRSFGFPAAQKPGHGTSTAHTVIGPVRSNGETGRPTPLNGSKNIFQEDYSSGLFPYVNFVPLRVGERVVLNLNVGVDSFLDVLEAVEYACKEGAHVLTMSMGADLWGKPELVRAARHAYERGVIFVCAAGNSSLVDALFNVVEPAAQHPETIAVAAIEPRRVVDRNGIAEHRFYPWRKGCDGRLVDVSAPAKYIYTAYIDNNHPQGAYKFGGATSQATAHVAAAAGLWRHHFAEELEHDWFQEQPSRIVDAFRWGLQQSLNIPPYWQDPSLRPRAPWRLRGKLRRAIENNKGILDARHLLDFGPDAYRISKSAETQNNPPLVGVASNPSTNPRNIIFNCQQSPQTDFDWKYETATHSDILTAPTHAEELPPTKDLREDWWKVADQGVTGSCVGWAAVDSVLRWHMVKAGMVCQNEPISVRFVWMAAKETDQFLRRPTGFIDASGTSLKAALDVLRKYGAVPEEVLPFGSNNLVQGSERDFYSLASRFKIRSYYNLLESEDTLRNFKVWLACRGPILVRLTVDRHFYNLGADGRLDQHNPGGQYGGHAVAIVGYTPDRFIIRNSWGDDWGDKGYAYVSYAYALKVFTEAYGITLFQEIEANTNTIDREKISQVEQRTNGKATKKAIASA